MNFTFKILKKINGLVNKLASSSKERMQILEQMTRNINTLLTPEEKVEKTTEKEPIPPEVESEKIDLPKEEDVDKEKDTEEKDTESTDKIASFKEAFYLFFANHFHKVLIGLCLVLIIYKFVDSNIELSFNIALSEDIHTGITVGKDSSPIPPK